MGKWVLVAESGEVVIPNRKRGVVVIPNRKRGPRSLIHEGGRLLVGHLLEDMVEDEKTIRRIALRWSGVQKEFVTQKGPLSVAAVSGIGAFVDHCHSAIVSLAHLAEAVEPGEPGELL